MKYLIGIIIAIGLFLAGLFIGKTYYAKQEIKIEEVKIEDTVWKDKYFELQQRLSKMPKITETEKEKISVDDLNTLIFCFNNPLDATHYTDANYLYVDITDGCKSANLRFKILAKSTKRHIVQAGFIYQFEIGPIYEISYLYNLDFIAIGGGGLINKNNPGIKIIIQKAF